MKKLTFSIPPHFTGARIDKTLVEILGPSDPEISRKMIKRAIDDGRLFLNSQAIRRAGHLLAGGEEGTLEIPSESELKLAEPAVLFRDEWVVAISKPSGLPTHATHDPGRDHAVAAITRYMKAEGDKAPYVAVHHRLDVETSGVLIFAIDKRANKGLSTAFQERKASKTYLAVIEAAKPLEASWSVQNHLGRDRHSRIKRQVAVLSGGDRAETHFRVLATQGKFALVEAKPVTGRMHQIRAHLSGVGAPIIGDELYGGATAPACCDRLALHAVELCIPHPMTASILTIRADLPDDLQALLRELGLTSAGWTR